MVQNVDKTQIDYDCELSCSWFYIPTTQEFRYTSFPVIKLFMFKKEEHPISTDLEEEEPFKLPAATLTYSHSMMWPVLGLVCICVLATTCLLSFVTYCWKKMYTSTSASPPAVQNS